MNEEDITKVKEVQAQAKKDYSNYFENIHKLNQQLLANIKSKLPELEELLNKINDHWAGCDCFYRFYHQSFKVYYIQEYTLKIYNTLNSLAPEGSTINEWVKQIVDEGTGKSFKSNVNRDWLKHTRPLIESFFHLKYFLELTIQSGKELNEAPTCLPSNWAAVLYYFSLR